MTLWTVYGVDRAGVPWEVGDMKDPAEILKMLAQLRAAHPTHVYGVYDSNNEELGDREAEIEELAQPCEYCGKVGH